MLFGYITSREAVNKFDKIKESFSSTSSNYEYLLQILNETIDNKEKKEDLLRDETELQLKIDNYKALIKNYESTQNAQFIDDAVEMYVKEMIPLLNQIMQKKYESSEVVYNENDNTFHLMQLPISLESLEYDLSSEGQRIISLKIGNEKKQTKSRRRNLKISENETKNSSENEEEAEPVEEAEDEDNESVASVDAGEEGSVASSVASSKSDEDSDEEEEEEEPEPPKPEPPKPKIIIHPKLLPDGSIAATEAHRLKYKMELVKGELIAINPQTNEIYKLTAGK